jgi:guanylate kinase
MRTLLHIVPKAKLLPSYTTRAPRPSDIAHKGTREYYQLTEKEILKRHAQGEYLELFGGKEHRYGTLYVTRVDDFNLALTSADVYVCALLVEGVRLFFEKARSLGFEDKMHAVFLDLKSEEERRRRLREGGGRNERRFADELMRVREDVSKSSEPFLLLDASTDAPEELAWKVLAHFKIPVEA